MTTTTNSDFNVSNQMKGTVQDDEKQFKSLHLDKINYLRNKIETFKNFPKPGILFQDFSPILKDRKAFQVCIDLLADRYSQKPLDAVVGLESRGFILGAALAYKLGIAFIPVRKAGKIPGDVFSVSYEKEYGKDAFCIAKDVIKKDQNILIVDDLIATGGSAKAAIDLVRKAKGKPFEFVTLLEIKELQGRKKLNVPTFNLID
jgi:adenine phosphoribosyltransferase